jgi:hypothetical protein
MKATSAEKKLTKTQAAAYLGVSTRKMGAMVKEGLVKATVDPLDRRRHLILFSSLNELKRHSLGKQEGKDHRQN